MNEENQRLAVAFIRTVANHCDSCYRRSPQNCSGCVALRAKNLLIKINVEDAKSRPQDFSALARKREILETLQAAGRPLDANEIKLTIPCTSQLKRWTLTRMVKERIICRKVKRIIQPSGYKIYSYFLPAKKGSK